MNIHQSYTLASPPQQNGFLGTRAILPRGAFAAALLFIDIALIVAMSCCTGTLYEFARYGEPGDVFSFARVGVLAAAIFVVSNLFRDEYRLANFFAFKGYGRSTMRLWTTTLVCLVTFGFLAQISADYSRGWIVLFYAATLAGLMTVRFTAVRLVTLARRGGLISAQRVFLIGAGANVGAFVDDYEPRTLGLSVVGCRFFTPVPASASAGTRKMILDGDLAEAAAGLRDLEPDAVFLLVPWSATEIIERCAETFLTLPVEIHLGPEAILGKFENVALSKLGPLTSLRLTRRPLSRFELTQKRILDLVLGSIALIALTPIMVAVATLIAMEGDGPVFFMQRRYGLNQKPFRIIKFRTMRCLDDGAVVPQAKRDDPRLTRLGRWLRRWNIDELPQLFNVLKGDMSLVGPRPHALSHDHDFERRISLYARRHNVKPGITGWAQVNGYRGETDTDDKIRKRVEHDLHYIDNWSLWLDLQIIARTALTPTAYKNAY